MNRLTWYALNSLFRGLRTSNPTTVAAATFAIGALLLRQRYRWKQRRATWVGKPSVRIRRKILLAERSPDDVFVAVERLEPDPPAV